MASGKHLPTATRVLLLLPSPLRLPVQGEKAKGVISGSKTAIPAQSVSGSRQDCEGFNGPGFMLVVVPVKPLQAHSPCILGLVPAWGRSSTWQEGKVPSTCAGKRLVRFAKGQIKVYSRSRPTPPSEAVQSHPSIADIVLCPFVRTYLTLLLNMLEAGGF